MSATVVAAGVTFAVVVVMVALDIWIKPKRAIEQCIDCGIRRAANTAVKLNARLGKCHPCAATDATANKSVNAEC